MQDPVTDSQMQGREQIGGQQQAQPVLAQRLGGGFLCGGYVEHGAILRQQRSAITASKSAQRRLHAANIIAARARIVWAEG